MVGQMDTNKVGPMDIGKKLRAKAVTDIAEWSIIIFISNVQTIQRFLEY